MTLKPMSASLRDLAQRMGVDPEAQLEPGPAWKPHAELIPDEDLADDRLAWERRRETWVTLNGSEEGFTEPEPRKCPGTLRLDKDEVEATDGSFKHHLSIHCDGCSYRAAIRRAEYDPEAAGKAAVVKAGFPSALVGPLRRDLEGQQQALRLFREWWDWWDQEAVKLRPKEERHLAPVIPSPGLYGEPGRGKSRILVAAARHVTKKHLLDTVYWSLADLLDTLRPKENREDRLTAEAAYKRAMDCDLLLLDDIGAERPTEFAQEKFQTLVDHRFSHALPLLVASNVPPEKWHDLLGARAASRLRGMVMPVLVDGPDMRQVNAAAVLADRRVDPDTGEVLE